MAIVDKDMAALAAASERWQERAYCDVGVRIAPTRIPAGEIVAAAADPVTTAIGR